MKYCPFIYKQGMYWVFEGHGVRIKAYARCHALIKWMKAVDAKRERKA